MPMLRINNELPKIFKEESLHLVIFIAKALQAALDNMVSIRVLDQS